jgi:hypothetical protein
MNPDGTELEQITENAVDDRAPAVSADGDGWPSFGGTCSMGSTSTR